MSQYNLGIKAFTAGADLAANRRVQLSGGTGGDTVIYATAGSSWIGTTMAAALSGDAVSVRLRNYSGSVKMTASGVVSAGAVVYPDATGKVTAVQGAYASIGTAFEAAAADGDIIEGQFDFGSGGIMDGATSSVEPEDSNGSIPIIFKKEGITDASTAVAIVTSMPFKARIINWWIISRDTTAANVKLKNATVDATANIAKGTANDTIVNGGTIVAAQKDLALAAALTVLASTSAAFDVYVKVVRVA